MVNRSHSEGGESKGSGPMLSGPRFAFKLAAWHRQEKMPGGARRGTDSLADAAGESVEDATRDGKGDNWNASWGATGLAWSRSAA